MSEVIAVTSKPVKKPLTRFGEFDFVKALAILGLPLVHVMESAIEEGLASPELTALGTAIIGLCAFGPSVFMICMGFGIGGGKSSPTSILRSGIQFVLIGAILNVLRWLLPGIMAGFFGIQAMIDTVAFCLQSDIYYFAGFFFIVYSFLKRWKLSTASIMLMSILALTVNNLLTPFIQSHVTNIIAVSLLGNLVYVNETSCFPLLSWFIFPMVGVLLGETLKKSTDEYRETFMRRMMDMSVVVLIAFGFFLYNYKVDVYKVLVSPLNEYITDLPNVILLIALACLLICLIYYLCKFIGSSKFMEFMLRISAFIIPFYLLQWIIIAWIMAILVITTPKGSFNLLYFFISVAATTVICIIISIKHGMKIMKFLIKITTFKKKKKKTGKAAARTGK